MSTQSIGSVITANFLQALASGKTSISSTANTSNSGSANKDAAKLTISGLSAGVKIFSQSISRLNSLVSFINITTQDLNQFQAITSNMIEIVSKATQAGIGQTARSSLNSEFDAQVTQFKAKISELSGRDYNGLEQTDIENIFSLMGFDKDTSDNFIDLIKQFSFADSSDGTVTMVSDSSQAKRPIKITQAAYQAKIRTVTSNGDGTFYQVSTSSTGTASSLQEVATGSIDSASGSDIAMMNASGKVFVNLANTDGTFKVATSYTVSTVNTVVGQIKVKDLNSDGYSDVITSTSNGSNQIINVALANSDGSLNAGVSTVVSTSIPSKLAFDVSDVDGDNLADLIYYDGTSGKIQVRKGAGNGTFSATASFLSGTYGSNGAYQIQTADMNGDSKSDIVLIQDQGISIINGNGNGTFSVGVSHRISVEDPAYVPGVSSSTFSANLVKNFVISDVNSDGNQDIVVADGGNSVVRTWKNLGSGTYTITNAAASSGTSSVFVRDVNNDGNKDILSIDPSAARISTYFGNGNATFNAAISTVLRATPAAAVAGDFNSDNLTDFFVINTTSSGNDSYGQYISTPVVTETLGATSGGKDFKTLFASTRDIKSRPQAFRMLADLNALQDQITTNLKTLDNAFNYVVDNMQMLRSVGLSFIDAEKEISQSSLADPQAITAIVLKNVRNAGSSVNNQLGNFVNILNATLGISTTSASTTSSSTSG